MATWPSLAPHIPELVLAYGANALPMGFALIQWRAGTENRRLVDL